MTDRAKDRLGEMAKKWAVNSDVAIDYWESALRAAYQLGRADENEAIAKEIVRDWQTDTYFASAVKQAEIISNRVRSRMSGEEKM